MAKIKTGNWRGETDSLEKMIGESEREYTLAE